MRDFDSADAFLLHDAFSLDDDSRRLIGDQTPYRGLNPG